MLAVTREEIKKLDEWAISELGIPRLVLMENAGRGVVSAVFSEIEKPRNVCVVCGTGNNGGDGFVVARVLAAANVDVTVFILSTRSVIKDESKLNLNILEKMSIPVLEMTDGSSAEKLASALKNCDVIVDAIFGVGFRGSVDGIFAKAIDLINSSKKVVVSVDIPSGLDADTGSVGDHCVNARITATFTYPKRGMFPYPAMDHVGKLKIIDIGIPQINPLNPGIPATKQKVEPRSAGTHEIKIITPDFVAGKIPARSISAHKGTCGTVLIIASSPGMTGACTLAARSALRVGAGLVRVGVPESLAQEIDSQFSEMITVALPETKNKTLSPGALNKILDLYRTSDCVAIGPGLSTDKETAALAKAFLKALSKENRKVPVVIDADALNAISDELALIRDSKTPIILTPHPGEMARLAGTTAAAIQSDREGQAKTLAKKVDAVVVLKGARTLVAMPDGRLSLNMTGNPGMASAGMGDVLTGAIAGLIAQGLTAEDAALSGVFLHGMSGDVVSALKGEHGIIASDLVEALPYVIRSILRR